MKRVVVYCELHWEVAGSCQWPLLDRTGEKGDTWTSLRGGGSELERGTWGLADLLVCAWAGMKLRRETLTQSPRTPQIISFRTMLLGDLGVGFELVVNLVANISNEGQMR